MELDDYHIKMQEIQELREAVKLKRINEELLEQLASSLRWLLHHSQKYNIPLPETDKIIALLERTMEITDKLPDYHSQMNTQNETLKDGTECIAHAQACSCKKSSVKMVS